MNIKSIETIYGGYRFRSRLEARWAVFFDDLKIHYQYESEGFELSNGDAYLPDFYLPQFETFVEVKPLPVPDIEFKDETVSFPHGYEKYAFAMHDITESGKSFLMVFGDPVDAITQAKKNGELHHGNSYFFTMCICINQIMERLKEGNQDWCKQYKKCEFYKKCGGMCLVRTSGSLLGFYECDGIRSIVYANDFVGISTTGAYPIGFFTDKNTHLNKRQGKALRRVFSSCRKSSMKARQARFEHGQNG